MSTPTVTLIDETALVGAISQATTRLVFLAPGVSRRLAQSLATAWRRLPKSTSIILDVSPEVCRLGYGELEGLQLLQSAARELATALCHQPGVRICVLVCDDSTWVFTPTPLLVEPMQTAAERPNGIKLGPPPPALANDLGIGEAAEERRTVGLDTVRPESVEKVAADIKANPPLPFDLSRQVFVFNSQVEFVEFNVCGIQIDRKEIKIPATLMGFADTASARTQLKASFTIKPDPALLEHKAKLEAEKNRIAKEFCHPMRGFNGSIILRSRKDEFLREAAKLEADAASFARRLQADLARILQKSEQDLVSLLLPAVLRSPPPDWRPLIRPQSRQPDTERLLKSTIAEALDEISRMSQDIKVQHLFKGVTYECLKDPDFIKLAQKHFPKLRLHTEFTAAHEAEGKPANP